MVNGFQRCVKVNPTWKDERDGPWHSETTKRVHWRSLRDFSTLNMKTSFCYPKVSIVYPDVGMILKGALLWLGTDGTAAEVDTQTGLPHYNWFIKRLYPLVI